MWAVLLSPAGCMWLCLCGERLWSLLYLVIKESLWQKPNIRRNELWTKELWQFQVMWFLCPFFAKWKINTFSGLYIFSVHRASALMERGAGDCELEWGSRLFVCHNCTIAFSNPLVNISELMWLPFMTAVMLFFLSFFFRHHFSHLHTQSAHPSPFGPYE